MALTPTTKLEAVNTLLTSIGEAPVNTLGSGLDEAALAESLLDEVSRAVQTIGWHWNTESDFPLMRNSAQEIALPLNALKIDFQTTRYVSRGRRAYDRSRHTYQFLSDITATIVFGLDWEELPEAMRSYVTYRSGRVFQGRQVSSSVLYQFTKEDENRALAVLENAELEVSNVSLFQNTELSLMLNRDASVPVIDYPAGVLGGSFHV